MIEVSGLTYAYPHGPALFEHLDLKLHPGELIGLLGPNGAGKSTLLRVLAGLLPAKGSIVFDGTPLNRSSRRQLSQRLAFVSQSLSITFPLTCREFVAMARYSRLPALGLGESKHAASIDEALERTGTASLSQRCVTELSGGEWQRVRLAQALAQEPQWLLLDEPTAHLDVRVQLELLELLARLNRERHLTVVMSLHDLNLALAYCQRLLLLDAGRLVLDLPPEEFAQHPALEQVFQVQFHRHEAPTQRTWVLPFATNRREAETAES